MPPRSAECGLSVHGCIGSPVLTWRRSTSCVRSSLASLEPTMATVLRVPTVLTSRYRATRS
eukprot:3147493-Rhodomonas_salina.4